MRELCQAGRAGASPFGDELVVPTDEKAAEELAVGTSLPLAAAGDTRGDEARCETEGVLGEREGFERREDAAKCEDTVIRHLAEHGGEDGATAAGVGGLTGGMHKAVQAERNQRFAEGIKLGKEAPGELTTREALDTVGKHVLPIHRLRMQRAHEKLFIERADCFLASRPDRFRASRDHAQASFANSLLHCHAHCLLASIAILTSSSPLLFSALYPT